MFVCDLCGTRTPHPMQSAPSPLLDGETVDVCTDCSERQYDIDGDYDGESATTWLTLKCVECGASKPLTYDENDGHAICAPCAASNLQDAMEMKGGER